MISRYAQLLLIFLVVALKLSGQNTEIDRLMKGELEMTFPSIYFKNNSTDYATMPYTVDSCFKYIAAHIKDINSFVIWRDSTETEKLTNKRIKKLKRGLNAYTPARKIDIHSMETEQKISRHTIDMGTDNKQIQYLLSLNSVFDISKARFPPKKWRGHVERPRFWCLGCWRRGAFSKEYRRLHVNKKDK